MLSSTALCQITGISRDQKIEIVSTLEIYPLILEQLELQATIISIHKESIKKYERQIELYENDISKLYQIKSNNEKHIRELEIQLKLFKKDSWLVPGLLGVVGGLVIGVIL